MSTNKGANCVEIDEQIIMTLAKKNAVTDQTTVQNQPPTNDQSTSKDNTEDATQQSFLNSFQHSLTDEEDMSIDAKLRNTQFIWSSPMVYALIDEYRTLIVQFRDPKMRQKDLWIKVADGMQKKGFNVDYQMCDRKWRNLKQTFKSIYYDRRKKRQRTWEFYEILQVIFAPDPRNNTRILRKSRMVLPIPDEESDTVATVQKRKRPKYYCKYDEFKNDISYHEMEFKKEVCPEPVENVTDQCSNTSQDDEDKEEEEPPEEEITFEEQEVQYKEVDGPAWFRTAMENLRADQRARVAEARRMHRELLDAEKRKCDLLEALLRVLQPPQG